MSENPASNEVIKPQKSSGTKIDDIIKGIEEGLDNQIRNPHLRPNPETGIIAHSPPIPEPATGGMAALADRIVGSKGANVAEKIRSLPDSPPPKETK